MPCTEYQLILKHYADRTSRRFGLPLMNHIHEGLRILNHLGASATEMKAWCLHPLVQSDSDLAATVSDPSRIAGAAPASLLIAMEYRATANASLSRAGIVRGDQIPLSLIPSVNTLLVADKVQNRKDFLLHAGDHFSPERHLELTRYFQAWLERLCISSNEAAELTDVSVSGDLGSAFEVMGA